MIPLDYLIMLKRGFLLAPLLFGVSADSENISFIADEDVAELKLELPDGFNWMHTGCMSLPRFQGACGSCAIISLTSAAEFSLCMASKKFVDLSEQQVIDCIYKDTRQSGCMGTDANDVINYIVDNVSNGTFCTAEERPSSRLGLLRPGDHCEDYTTCKTPLAKQPLHAYKMHLNSVETVKKALLKYGPLALTMDTRVRSFTYYGDFSSPLASENKVGLVHDTMCHSEDKDTHAAVVVGWDFDAETKEEYWLLWNTFSVAWGEGGVGKIKMETDHCGILGNKTLIGFSPMDISELGWAGSMAALATKPLPVSETDLKKKANDSISSSFIGANLMQLIQDTANRLSYAEADTESALLAAAEKNKTDSAEHGIFKVTGANEVVPEPHDKFTYLPEEHKALSAEDQTDFTAAMQNGLNLVMSGKYREFIHNPQQAAASPKEVLVQRQRFKVIMSGGIATVAALIACVFYIVSFVFSSLDSRMKEKQTKLEEAVDKKTQELTSEAEDDETRPMLVVE